MATNADEAHALSIWDWEHNLGTVDVSKTSRVRVSLVSKSGVDSVYVAREYRLRRDPSWKHSKALVIPIDAVDMIVEARAMAERRKQDAA